MVLAILSVGFLSNCGLSQNPLEGFPAPVQNARPPATKPEVPIAVASDALRLNTPSIASFFEGTESQFEIMGRVLLPNYIGRIEVLNLSDFRGATFDIATGLFIWTPPKGIVIDGLMVERELRVRLIAESVGQIPLVRLKSIKIFVQRQAGQPIVDSVSTRANQFREGGSYDFEISVIDPDSGITMETAPRVVILNPPNAFPKIKSLASFMTSLSSRISDDGKSWIFRYRLNLNGEEVTESSIQSGFDVQAISRFGGVSDIIPYRVRVLTRLGSLVSSTLRESLRARAETAFHHVFFTWDFRQEARLELLSHSGLPANATFTCASVAQGQLRCVLNWVPTAAQVGTTVNLSYLVRGSNMDASDTQTVQGTFSQQILVVKADESLKIDEDNEDSRTSPDEGEKDIQLPNFSKVEEQ